MRKQQTKTPTSTLPCFNYSFSFRFCGVKFKIDIDESFSAKYEYENVTPHTKESSPHYHPKHELFYVFDEPLTIVTEDRSQEFSNCMVLIPPFRKHRTSRTGDFRILFSYEMYEKSEFSDFICGLSIYTNVAVLGSIEKELSLYLNDLLYMFTSRNTLNNEIIESTLKILFYKFFMANGGTVKEVTKKESYILTIERIINDRSTDSENEVSLELVSRALNLSKKQVSRVIKRHFGKSLSTLVLEKKLTVACELLVESELPISEISKKINFKSENYFYLKFKQMFGITPLKYRKTHKEK